MRAFVIKAVVPKLMMSLLAFGGMAFMSCAVQADANLALDKSVQLHMRMSMNPILVAYLNDLNAAMGGKGNGGTDKSVASIVDLGALKVRLAKEPGVIVQSVDPVEGGGVDLNLSVKDVSALFASKGKDLTGVFVLMPQGDKTKLSLTLDRKAVEVILGYGGKQQGDLTAVLPQDPKIDAKAYQGQLAWAFSDYGQKAELDRMFKESVISLQITLPRPVQSATGFTISDKARGKVQLNIPVLEVLTLQKPFKAEAVF